MTDAAPNTPLEEYLDLIRSERESRPAEARLLDEIENLRAGKATLIRENKRLADMVARLSPGYRP